MKKLISSVIFLSLLFALAALPVSAAREPSVASDAAVVLNAEDGEIFYAKNASVRVYPADTAMLMTALLAVEAVESGSAALYAEIAVPEDAAGGLPEGAAMLLPGETLTLESLLYLALLPSSADACNTIAAYLSGSVPAFVSAMNDRARELGCGGTHFSSPHGLYDDGSYTTAADMALIALEASRHGTLMELCGAPSAAIPATELSPARTVENLNALLCGDTVYGSGYLYERASGLKNGLSGAAGYTLLASAADPDSGVRLVSAVFGGVWDERGCTSFSDTVALFDWVFGSYSYQEVLDPNVSVASVDVSLGKDTDYVNLRPAGAVTLLLPEDYDPDEIQYDMHVYSLERGEPVTAPITAGEELGEVRVLRDGRVCGTVKLVAATSVDLSRGQYISAHLKETAKTPGFFWLCFAVAVILGAYIAWVAVYRVRRRRYVGAVKDAAARREREREKPAPAPAQEPEIEFFSGGDEPPAPEPAEASDASLEDTTALPDLSELEPPEADAGLPPEPEPEPERKSPPADPSIYKGPGRDYFEEFFRKK